MHRGRKGVEITMVTMPSAIASRDSGATWSDPVRVNGDPLGNGRDQFFSWMAIDPADGSINIAYYDRGQTDGVRTGVTLARSQDGGRKDVADRDSRHDHNGDRLVFDSPVRVSVLWPPWSARPVSDNEASCVLLVEFAGRRILLPADLEGAGLAELIAHTPGRFDVVTAPHHGAPAPRRPNSSPGHAPHTSSSARAAPVRSIS